MCVQQPEKLKMEEPLFPWLERIHPSVCQSVCLLVSLYSTKAPLVFPFRFLELRHFSRELYFFLILLKCNWSSFKCRCLVVLQNYSRGGYLLSRFGVFESLQTWKEHLRQPGSGIHHYEIEIALWLLCESERFFSFCTIDGEKWKNNGNIKWQMHDTKSPTGLFHRRRLFSPHKFWTHCRLERIQHRMFFTLKL